MYIHVYAYTYMVHEAPVRQRMSNVSHLLKSMGASETMYVYVYAWMYMDVYMYMCIHGYTWMYIYMCVYMDIHGCMLCRYAYTYMVSEASKNEQRLDLLVRHFGQILIID